MARVTRSAGSLFVKVRPLEAAAALAFIWTIAVVVAVGALGHGRFTLIPVFAAFVLYLTLVSLPVVLPGNDSGFFHPVVFFVLCHAMIALVRFDAALAAGMLDAHRALPNLDQAALDGVVAQRFILGSLSLLGLYTGFAVTPYLIRRRLPEVRPKALRLKAILWVGVSALAVLVLAAKGGGVGALLLQRGLPAAERIGADTGGHWHFLAGIGTVVPVIWLAFRPAAIRTLLYWMVTASSLVLIFLARGSRSSVLVTLIVMGIVWTLHARKIPYKVVLLGLAVTVIIIGVLGEFRKATRGEAELGDVEIEPGVGSAFESGVRDLAKRGIDDNGQIAVLGRVPSEVGHLWGRSYLSVPFVALPSALIGGQKPPTAGRLNAVLVHERADTAIPAGAVGEAYWNFSYPGPFLVYLLYGAILKVIAGIYATNHDHPVVLSLYVFVLFRFLPGSDAFYDLVHALVPTVAFLLFVVFPFGTAPRRRPVRRPPLTPVPRLDGARVT